MTHKTEEEALDEQMARLMAEASYDRTGYYGPMLSGAADTVGDLQAENAKLREAMKAEYERGQRDMRERLTTVAVEQCGGGFHDRKRMRSAIAAIPITKDEKEGGE